MKKLCLGTWQLDSKFNKLTTKEAKELLEFVISDTKIDYFDTARVYGNGEVEKILSQVLSKKENIITKIPAKKKPSDIFYFPLEEFYSKEQIIENYEESKRALGRVPNIVLLHNWSKKWEYTQEGSDILAFLNIIKEQEGISDVGVSLPNSYDGKIDDWLLSRIDILEVPYNNENRWILKYIEKIEESEIKLAIRSIFSTGKFFKDNNKNYYRSELEIKKTIENALLIADILIIGMTTKEHLIKNIKYFEEVLS